MCDYDASQVLREISIPVVVFSGDGDPVTLPSANRFMAGELLRGRLQPLNPGRHYGLIEHNADFAGATAAVCRQADSDAVGTESVTARDR